MIILNNFLFKVQFHNFYLIWFTKKKKKKKSLHAWEENFSKASIITLLNTMYFTILFLSQARYFYLWCVCVYIYIYINCCWFNKRKIYLNEYVHKWFQIWAIGFLGFFPCTSATPVSDHFLGQVGFYLFLYT